MTYMTHVATLSGSSAPHGAMISDLEIIWRDGVAWLHAGSYADGGLVRYALASGTAALQVQTVPGAARNGQLGLSDIEVVRIGGVDYLLPAGAWGDLLTLRPFRADGGLGGMRDFVNGADLGGLSQIAGVATGAMDLLLGAVWGERGLNVWSVGADLTARLVERRLGSAKEPLDDIADIETLRIGGQDFAIVASDGAVSSYRVLPGGGLDHVDMIGAPVGLGIGGISDIETVTAHGRTFVLVAGADTGTMTVLRLNDMGVFFQTDHRTDSLATRFGGVQDIATFEHNGRVFVVGGGSDDGLTLWELGPGGRLYLLQTLPQRPGWTLDDVTAVEAVVLGSEAQIFVAGEGVAGLTQFRVDLSRFGAVVMGDASDGIFRGTARDDHLETGTGNNRLFGEAGDDRLVASGPGTSQLWGGAGADTFVFHPGGGTDRIMDFQPGLDRIDLSAYPMLYSRAGLTIQSTDWGARLTVQGDVIEIRTLDGTSLTAANLPESVFLWA